VSAKRTARNGKHHAGNGKPPVSRRTSMTVTDVAEPHDTERYCDALTRNSETKNSRCRRPAGWGTEHAGLGRCKLHGGATPVRHGRYSTIKREELRTLIEQHEADPDPLNIFPELATARALFQDFVERYDAWRDAIVAWHESYKADSGTAEGKPRQMLDIADAYRIISEVTKIAERIERIRAQNAISRGDLNRVLSEMWRVLEMHVANPTTRQEVRDGMAQHPTLTSWPPRSRGNGS
jgi:hypothetical protein